MNNGPRGDLYIRFIIENHSKFKLDHNNLHSQEDIDLYQAMLGDDITVDTFDGKVKLKGQGFPVYKKEGQFGYLYITYNVKLPTGLSEKERELFNELAKLRST